MNANKIIKISRDFITAIMPSVALQVQPTFYEVGDSAVKESGRQIVTFRAKRRLNRAEIKKALSEATKALNVPAEKTGYRMWDFNLGEGRKVLVIVSASKDGGDLVMSISVWQEPAERKYVSLSAATNHQIQLAAKHEGIDELSEYCFELILARKISDIGRRLLIKKLRGLKITHLDVTFPNWIEPVTLK